MLAAWEARNAAALERAQRLLAELADAKGADLAMLSVALRELRNLAYKGLLTLWEGHAPGRRKPLGKARRAARAGRPGKRRNAAQRLAPPRPGRVISAWLPIALTGPSRRTPSRAASR